jgi:hypothetical protein
LDWVLVMGRSLRLATGLTSVFFHSSALRSSSASSFISCSALRSLRLRGLWGFSLACFALESRFRVLSLWFANLGALESRSSNLFLLVFPSSSALCLRVSWAATRFFLNVSKTGVALLSGGVDWSGVVGYREEVVRGLLLVKYA